MERYDLPDRWAWTTLGNVCFEPQYGYTTKASEEQRGPRFLRITDLASDGTVDWATVPYCEQIPDDPDKFRLNDGDFVIARTGATVGKAYRVSKPPDAVFASYLIRFRPLEVSATFLEFFLRSFGYWQQIADNSTGTAQDNVNAQKLKRVEIPLPPLPEQRRIVARIETLFAQSRAAREALDRVPLLIKQFRQAVLAAAFRGDLTERDPNAEPASALLERIRAERHRKWEDDLRAKRKDPAKATYEQPAPPDTSNLPELPEGWAWIRFEEILTELKNGFFAEAPAQEGPGIPILRINSVRPTSVSFSDLRYVRQEMETVAAYRLRDGDLLFTRYNGSLDLVGVCGMVRGLQSVLIYPDKLIRARISNESALPEYLELYFATQFPRRVIEEKAKSSAGQQGISGRDLKNVPVALAPLNEQSAIVLHLQSMFARADIMDQAVAAAHRQLDDMEQAILARAFRGELVPQDPSDEPASALLERIRAERDVDIIGGKKVKPRVRRMERN